MIWPTKKDVLYAYALAAKWTMIYAIVTLITTSIRLRKEK